MIMIIIYRLNLPKPEKPKQIGHLILAFTEEESAAAIALFGCDCVKSINALRQMRGIALGVEGDRILPGSPIKTCSENRLR